MAKIELSDLNSCLFSPRELSSEELAALKASIRHFSHTLEGWQPEVGYRLATTITVNRQGSRIVGGHQRVKALLSLGQTWIHSDDITWVDMKPDGAEEKALNLTLNNPHNQGDFTSEALPLVEGLLADLPELTADLDLERLLEDIACASAVDERNLHNFDVSPPDGRAWVLASGMESDIAQVLAVMRQWVHRNGRPVRVEYTRKDDST